MIQEITAYIQPIITKYGAIGVFLATIIEEIIAPIPSPLVPLTAGFFLLQTNESFLVTFINTLILIALPVAFGITIGSIAVYAIGYWGGKPVIDKLSKWLGLSWGDILKTEQKLTRGKGDEITLFSLRVIPIIPGVAISGFCGIVRYPIKTFIPITFVGAFVRATILGLLGWYTGVMYLEYVDKISKVENYLFLGILLIFIVFTLRHFYLKSKNSK